MLSIAGSDPSGGAGIQADLKTFESLGVDGCAIPVALTVQNSRGVTRVEAVARDLVDQQLEAILSDVSPRAVKIGMLATAGIVHAVANALRRYPQPFVVLDPVIRSTSGAQLLDDAGVDVMRRELLPLTTLITPNAAEAGVLLGAAAPTTIDDAREAAARLCSLGACNVVVTGGHTDGSNECVDVFAGVAGAFESHVPRVYLDRTHGTGCRYSSAVASLVARGASITEACEGAQRFVWDWLTTC